MYIKYDGTNYYGFAIQKNYRTIQGSIQLALKKIFKEEISVICSGRTDRGVHAIEQIVSFKNQKMFNLVGLIKTLNNKICNDIEIIKIEIVDNDFHARFSIKSKTYKYVINNGTFDVFMKNYQTHIFQNINVDKMVEASKDFLGEHDFLSFSTSCKANNVRTIIDIVIHENDNRIITIEVTANGFLRYMVRMMVAKLINIGIGKTNNIHELLENPRKGASIFKVESQGLYLNTINY